MLDLNEKRNHQKRRLLLTLRGGVAACNASSTAASSDRRTVSTPIPPAKSTQEPLYPRRMHWSTGQAPFVVESATLAQSMR